VLSNTRMYLRKVMNDLGYKEHPEAFTFENIASRVLDKSYHVSYTTTTGIDRSQATQAADVGLVLRVFFKGFNKNAEKMDFGYDSAEEIISSAISPDRVQNNSFKVTNCTFDTLDVFEFSPTNDSSLFIEINFTLRVNFCFTN
jgi:hypothetical protein